MSVVTAIALLCGHRTIAQAPQSRTTFVKLGQGVPGVLYEPSAPGNKSQIAIFVMPCEKYPGEFGDTQKTTYDYVDKWLSAPGRF
jgi:hypothetical protein